MKVSGQLHALDTHCIGPQNQSGRCGEKNLLPQPRIEPRPSSPYPVAILTYVPIIKPFKYLAVNVKMCPWISLFFPSFFWYGNSTLFCNVRTVLLDVGFEVFTAVDLKSIFLSYLIFTSSSINIGFSQFLWFSYAMYRIYLSGSRYEQMTVFVNTVTNLRAP
jgi:hypothetical protein